MRQADSFEPVAAASHVPPGTLVGGRFQVEEELSEETDGPGSGTRLFRATDTQPSPAAGEGQPAERLPRALRIVPLQVLAVRPEAFLERLAQVRVFQHKNLAEIVGVGRERDFIYVATEWVDGQTLRAFIDGKRAEGRGVSLKGASNLVAHVANALEYARPMGPHGALNPTLILVNRTGRVKVEGFGLAAGLPGVARVGHPAGLPDTLYMAPELLTGAPPTVEGDVYALGMILYELLTGEGMRHPYRPVSDVVPGIPTPVDAVIERALALTPGARWATPAVLKTALQSAAAGLPVNLEAGAAPHDESQSSSGTAPRAWPSAPPGGGAPPGADRAVLPLPVGPIPGSGQVAAQAGLAGSALPVGLAAGPSGAPGSIDDQDERWLVQKGNLDFGPFSMAQIRAQIERGEILGDHTLLDSHSGERGLVREVPGLGDLAKHAHRQLERTRREHAEQRSQQTQKKKSMATTAIVTLVVAVVVGGGLFYVFSRRDASGGHLASRQEESEVESFLKGVKLGEMKATVRRGTHHAGGTVAGAAAGGPDEFNNDSRFGDATRGMAQGDQTLDDDQIQTTMMANYRRLIPCIAHAPGMSNLAIDFVVRGSGKVSAVKVNGQKGGSLPTCVLARMQSFNFPKFDGSKTIASWSMSMGH
jgi:hypothetical protein